jgi:uncharacterized protein
VLSVCRRFGATGVAVFAAALLAGLLSGCQPNFNGLRLTVASGSLSGVYQPLGTTLAKAWSSQLGIPAPDVRQTNGSLQNLDLLCSGAANVGFSAADAAAARIESPQSCQRPLRALARMHDDYYQVVARADSPARRLSDLRGMRVSIGAAESGVQLIAKRLLTAANMSVSDIVPKELGLEESIRAFQHGTIDAFFWSGGLPTEGISTLAKSVKLRILDLSDVLRELQRNFPAVYGTGTVPASTYFELPSPATTLVVRNFLLVPASMPDDVAEALTRGIFAAQPQLASANIAARSIDQRSAIETSPIPLHPGAERYYRANKT